MFIVELELAGDQMIVPGRNVDDLIVGNAFPRVGGQHIYGHQEQQGGTDCLSSISAEKLSERFQTNQEPAFRLNVEGLRLCAFCWFFHATSPQETGRDTG